jgi:Cellulase (glycosyl hydrolase family 5)
MDRVVLAPISVCLLAFVLVWGSAIRASAAELSWIRVSEDKTGFVAEGTNARFVPWGVNYDHDRDGRLLEDYWESDWSTVEQDFAEIRELPANVVRVHLQFGRFMDGPRVPNTAALKRLSELVELAGRTGLYLDLTGLGCYHKKDVPAWYDELSEPDRWNAQCEFWKAVAGQCKDSPAIFCYDLMNEPVVPGGRRSNRDWLGPAFAGKHFVQFITLEQGDRQRPDVARAWLRQLTTAIRQVDDRHLITVGLVDWSLDRPGLTSGFVPGMVREHVDFLSVHLYPVSGKTEEALKILDGFAIGKPVVIEETFPLKCSAGELGGFIRQSRKQAAGWISFYWGKSTAELRDSKDIGDAILFQWLECFRKLAVELALLDH